MLVVIMMSLVMVTNGDFLNAADCGCGSGISDSDITIISVGSGGGAS